MKRHYLSIMLFSSTALLWACNNAGEGSANKTTDSSSTSTMSTTNTATGAADTGMAKSSNMSSANAPKMSSTPLAGADKDFVMKAANGGMMEVQGGQMAQQNGNSQRVKDFGTMMINDHTKANDELKALASAKGMTLSDSIKGEEKSHLDMLKKKTGQAFDKAYMEMMVADHKKDISEFEKASKDAKDADLKNFATKTLPVLKTHLDSAQAVNKSKM